MLHATPDAPRPMASWTDGLDLRAIAEVHGTPLYLHHPESLRRSFTDWAALVGAAGVRYPVKANPSPEVLEAIARLGGGADCASPIEVRAALSAGIPLDRIGYHSPAADADEAAWLLSHGATVVADGVAMLRALEARLDAGRLAGRLFVRVRPGVRPTYQTTADHQRYTAHGDPRAQFGVPSHDLLDVLAGTRLPVTGLHVHVGTMMDNVTTFVDTLAFLHALADAARASTPHDPRTLNLGGGLGLPHDRGQSHPTVAALVAALRPHLRADLAYEVEPGNSLVGDTYALLTRVVAVKREPGRTWAICDVGTDQLVKHTVAGMRHEIVDAGGRPLPTHGPDAVAGPLCFVGDVLLPETHLDGVEPGDPLLVRHAGAYCEAIASRFNGRLGPATVVVEHGHVTRVARTREDPFHTAASTATRPVPKADPTEPAEPIPDDALAALRSPYMHALAADDRYELTSARRIGPGVYAFVAHVHTTCGFLGLPLAVRILGDASIVAVGLELGWDAKRAPVLASRLALSMDVALPGHGSFPCRVRVGALAPAGRTAEHRVGTVHFELDAGPEAATPAIHGTARVSVPAAT
jgi:diaminopimelate decarboxylase